MIVPQLYWEQTGSEGGAGLLSVAIMIPGADQDVHGHIRWFLFAKFLEKCLKHGFLVGRRFLLSLNAGKENC